MSVATLPQTSSRLSPKEVHRMYISFVENEETDPANVGPLLRFLNNASSVEEGTRNFWRLPEDKQMEVAQYIQRKQAQARRNRRPSRQMKLKK
jgi:hypothetical protein